MNINEELVSKQITISSMFYGINDIATNIEAKQIIDHASFFDNLFIQYPFNSVNTIDDYYNFLLARKITDFEEFIPYLVQEQHKALLCKLVAKAKDRVASVKIGDIIKLINTSYHTLLSISFEPYGLTEVDDVTIDFITDHRGGISPDVIEYIFQKHTNIVLMQFDRFECMLKDNSKLFDILFPQYDLQYLLQYSFSDTLNVIAHLYSKKEYPFHSKLESLIKTLSCDIEALAASLNIDSILMHHHIVSQYIAFLRRIKHVDANRFEYVQHNLDKLLAKSIEKSGHIYNIEIPSEKIKSMLMSMEPIYKRILFITHTPDKTLHWRCNLNTPPEYKKTLMDIVTTNIPTNDYFSFSHQRLLDSIVLVGSVAIYSIFSGKTITDEFLRGYADLVYLIADETHSDKDELLSDFELLAQMISNIISIPNDSDSLVVQSLCYGAATFICAFSEKLLRLCFFEEKKNDIYIPLNKATIGTLLDDNNAVMVKILGEYQIKHLNYFFSQDKDSVVGMSYRNRLAHWNGITSSQLTPQFIYQLFYLFTCILNSIVLYYSDKNRECDFEQEEV